MAQERKLWAFIACRNQGSRLWGKPLQNLSIDKNITILEYMVKAIKKQNEVEGIVLAISEGVENTTFIDMAEKLKVSYVIGDEDDVLGRLVKCFNICDATDALRITSECPFPAFEYLEQGWSEHINNDVAMSCLDFVPDGCGFEIITKRALTESHKLGDSRHRSELCTLFIRENRNKYLIQQIAPLSTDKRPDLRLTVDYPEDLIVARAVFEGLSSNGTQYPKLSEIIIFLEGRDDLVNLVDRFVDAGMKTMYQ